MNKQMAEDFIHLRGVIAEAILQFLLLFWTTSSARSWPTNKAKRRMNDLKTKIEAITMGGNNKIFLFVSHQKEEKRPTNSFLNNNKSLSCDKIDNEGWNAISVALQNSNCKLTEL